MIYKFIISSVFCVFLLSSCTPVDGEFNSQDQSQNSTQKLIGTNGQLIPIQSNNAQAAGYDELSGIMVVKFKNGAIYEYFAVSTELWEDFLQAQPDPWSLVGYPRLVQAGVPYRRIS